MMELLNQIQQKLKAPKTQYNKFGEYYYRSCEDILEAVKPLLHDGTLTLSDEVVSVGGWNYVKATATLYDGKETVTNTAYAREQESRPKMDSSQLTGGASTYARKYALNGLFLIDDTKDADATNDHGKGDKAPTKQDWSDQLRMINEIHELRDQAACVAWHSKNEAAIDALPQDECIQVNLEYENRLKIIESGDEIPVIRIKMNAAEADKWLPTAEAEIKRCTTEDELKDWKGLNEGRIMGLDKTRQGVIKSMYQMQKDTIKKNVDVRMAG